MKIQKRTLGKKTKIITTVVVVALVLSAVVTGYFIEQSRQTPSNQAENSSNQNDQSIQNNSDPSYSSEKTNNTSNQTSPEVEVGSKKEVPVGISYAGPSEQSVEVKAFISEVIEGTGTCTAQFTNKLGESLTTTSVAFIDATTTQCESLSLPLSDFSSGMWSVTVTYTSNDATGTSSPLEFEV